jgi:N-acetylglucosaminyldiphosphoundecaprenol N-acetyl-beta-D-mannosaminyltransferase
VRLRTDILGVGFDNLTLDEATGLAAGMISSSEKNYVVTPNPEIVYMCRADEKLKKAVSSAAIVLPDGIGSCRVVTVVPDEEIAAVLI